jgi:hypothetical protein
MSISENPSLASALPHSATTALRWGRGHALAELSNNVDEIMTTISAWDTNFALLSSPPDGELSLRVLTTVAEVRDLYVGSVARHLDLAHHRFNEINGSWYQLTEQRADLQILATGERERVHVVVVFPTWPDGIIGELIWSEPSWATRAFGEEDQIELSHRLDAFDDAWRSGDLDGRLATIEEQTSSAIRIADADGDHRFRAVAHTKAELRDAWSLPEAGRVVDFERVHQCITSWYVFASYKTLLELPGRTVARETARLMPVGPNGKFVGELSYSMQTDA